LITETDLTNVDQKRLYRIYEEWPYYFKESAALSCKLDHPADYYTSIVFCGMGGSATSCDILNDLLQSHTNVYSTVLRGQHIPLSTNKHSLVVVKSISGNTQEVISMTEEASKRNAEIICVTSGGKLKELAIKESHKVINIPDLSIPRASLPYLLMPGLNLISPFLPSTIRNEIKSLPNSLSKVARDIAVSVPEKINEAKKIARFLENSFTFCFTSPNLYSAGSRFKNSLNENAKVHCINESILEASHNEIVPFSFDNKSNLSRRVLFLRWKEDPAIVNNRFQKVKHFFRSIGQPFKEVNAFDEGIVSAIVASIYLLDYSTIYMAIASNLDPAPTPAIDILKEI
jgi:glucose/mannose-6-phosphate isomerase